MKRRIIVFILSLLLLAINPDVFAQKAKPKGGGTKSGGGAKAGGTKSGGGAKAGGAKSGTTKGKKGKKGKGEPAVADTTSTVAPPPVAETNNGPAEDTGFATPENLIAASDSFDFGKVDLDTAKPFTGYVASNLNLLKGAKPFPFPQEDIHSIKPFIRIWRDIYTTDSENRVFSMPGNTLIDFLIKGIKAGKIAAYEDETFRKKMTYAKIMKKLRDSSLINLTDTTTGETIGTKMVFNDYNPDSVTHFEIMEDIFFDKVRGKVITKIIYLAPIKTVKTANGSYVGESHTFYLNFQRIRNLLAAKEVVDAQRDIYNISFDDLFIQRAFKSQINKESNAANMAIKEKYPDAVRQKKEADRIEREIQQFKRNLWRF